MAFLVVAEQSGLVVADVTDVVVVRVLGAAIAQWSPWFPRAAKLLEKKKIQRDHHAHGA